MVTLSAPELERIRAIQGLLAWEEGQELAELAAACLPNLAIVEVGAYTGLSTSWLAYGARAGNGARVTTVDPWPMPRADDPSDHAARMRQAFDAFRANMAEAGWPVTTLRATGLEVARFWVQPVGVLFLDADAAYPVVSANWRAWEPHLAEGGLVAFHDYLGDTLEPTTGVARLVDELAAAGTLDPVASVGKMVVALRPFR